MKKFERLPLEQRKKEIQLAALKLFGEKGFSATTMENIVSEVSLSKGGVYRIYPSTSAILSELIIGGMRLRNAYYAKRVKELHSRGKQLDIKNLVEIIGDSMLLYPEISSVYVEFLWEKRRNPELQKLYQDICETSIKETTELIKSYGAEDILLKNPCSLMQLTELMNSAILSLHVLDLKDFYSANKEQICEFISKIISV